MATKAAVPVLARFTRMFLSDLCLCAKAYVLYADGANRVCCIERTRVSVTRHACACVLVCVFLWVLTPGQYHNC